MIMSKISYFKRDQDDQVLKVILEIENIYLIWWKMQFSLNVVIHN